MHEMRVVSSSLIKQYPPDQPTILHHCAFAGSMPKGVVFGFLSCIAYLGSPRYNTWLVIKLTPNSVVCYFLFSTLLVHEGQL